MNKVCILGSLNMDLVVKVKEMPTVGQTIIGESFTKVPGGKGANQAVASKRTGSQVYMIGKVGIDENGNELIKELEKDNIITDFIFKDDSNPTGTAIINVNNHGDNSIVVIPGANMEMREEELDNAKEAIKASDILIAQFETSLSITIKAFKFAKENGVITILNPAPAKSIPEELLKYTDIIVPNETEAFDITKVKVEELNSAVSAAEIFLKQGTKYVIITMGDKGAAVISRSRGELIPAYKVSAVDTTAAGDSFIGALASKLNAAELNYETLKKAVIFGNMVSSITVQRRGAQPSIPTMEEVLEVYKEA